MLKKGNERITITITPHEKEILQVILRLIKRKSYTCAFRILVKEYELRLKALTDNLEWEVVENKK